MAGIQVQSGEGCVEREGRTGEHSPKLGRGRGCIWTLCQLCSSAVINANLHRLTLPPGSVAMLQTASAYKRYASTADGGSSLVRFADLPLKARRRSRVDHTYSPQLATYAIEAGKQSLTFP